MTRQREVERFRTVGDGSSLTASDSFYPEEVQLALRNRGMPLEALRYSLTPTGMHYLLIHFDIPEVDAGKWRLNVGGLVANPLSLTLEDIKAPIPTEPPRFMARLPAGEPSPSTARASPTPCG